MPEYPNLGPQDRLLFSTDIARWIAEVRRGRRRRRRRRRDDEEEADRVCPHRVLHSYSQTDRLRTALPLSCRSRFLCGNSKAYSIEARSYRTASGTQSLSLRWRASERKFRGKREHTVSAVKIFLATTTQNEAVFLYGRHIGLLNCSRCSVE